MKKILYHGSEFLIEKPEFGKGARHNDYGRGFYCTENIELAREWACAKQKNGYVNIYELDMEGLKVLNLNDSKYHILNWLAILADNRTYWQNGSIAEEAKKYIKEHFLIDITPYDIIVGYRADDSYFSFAQDFVSGVISGSGSKGISSKSGPISHKTDEGSSLIGAFSKFSSISLYTFCARASKSLSNGSCSVYSSGLKIAKWDFNVHNTNATSSRLISSGM